MALQPDTDAGLGRSVKQLRTLGARLLLAGGILFAIGLLLMLAGDGVLDFLGILVAGLALLISSLFARGAAKHRPLA